MKKQKEKKLIEQEKLPYAKSILVSIIGAVFVLWGLEYQKIITDLFNLTGPFWAILLPPILALFMLSFYIFLFEKVFMNFLKRIGLRE